MRTFFSNRYLDAFAKSILIFGMIHIITLIILAFRDGQSVLNIFTILDFHLFIPGLEEGLANFILSYCFATGFYCFILFRWTEKTKKNT
jgi:hypothetical protein